MVSFEEEWPIAVLFLRLWFGLEVILRAAMTYSVDKVNCAVFYD